MLSGDLSRLEEILSISSVLAALPAAMKAATLPPRPSNTTAILRELQGCQDSDHNAADFITGAPNPRNSAAPVYSCSAPRVSSTNPPHGQVGAQPDSPIIINFNQPVTTSLDWYTLVCSQSGAIASSSSGTNETRTITPVAATFLPGDNCTVTVYKEEVTNAASETMTADYIFSFTVSTCGEPYTAINAVQGSGMTSPKVGEDHTLEGDGHSPA
jgi:uncharacterized protein